MCGIFGYSGKRSASETILEGLKSLEYRGYDSWGIATKVGNSIERVRKVGKIGQIQSGLSMSESYLGIGHTRWATHGGVTQNNAHPHFSKDKSFVVAQNGIVENFQDLKETLGKKGHQFLTQTDTEVIVRLIEEKLKKTKDLRQAIRQAFLELEGRNTIIVLSAKKDQIIAVRNGSPLVVGLGKDEIFFSSDTLPFAATTKKVLFIKDLEMVELLEGDLRVSNVQNDVTLPQKVVTLDQDFIKIDKGGFEHFMLKEIFEQKHTLREVASHTEKDFEPLVKALKKAGRVYTIGAGSASYVAGQIAFFLRKHAKIQATELKSYEISSYAESFQKNDVMIVISQSGETADTISAIQAAQKKGVKIASIVNMMGSTIPRMADFPFFTRSGPEIAVASTKALTAQTVWGFLLSQALVKKYSQAVHEVKKLSDVLRGDFFTEKNLAHYRKLAKKLKKHHNLFVLGRGQNYFSSLEGALKIKEIAYLHTEGFASGELKHGVIALIEKGTPVFLQVSQDEHQSDLISAAAEVKARGAWVIGVGGKNNDLFDDFLFTPSTPHLDCISMVLPFQLLAYYLGVELGYDPDKPRNLAKSVTVK